MNICGASLCQMFNFYNFYKLVLLFTVKVAFIFHVMSPEVQSDLLFHFCSIFTEQLPKAFKVYRMISLHGKKTSVSSVGERSRSNRETSTFLTETISIFFQFTFTVPCLCLIKLCHSVEALSVLNHWQCLNILCVTSLNYIIK